MRDAKLIAPIRRKYRSLRPGMDERVRRHWAGAEVRDLGWGGITAVAEATGLSRATITAGLRELAQPARVRAAQAERVRRPGGGRKAVTERDPELAAALDALIDPVTRGDPESPLRWTCKSTYRLAEELTRTGHPVSPRTVAMLLHAAQYRLQANRKTREGASHPDRNAQFEYINAGCSSFRTVGSRQSAWIPRRKSWWETSRTPAAPGGRAASPRTCASTTSRIPSWARRSPMGSTT